MIKSKISKSKQEMEKKAKENLDKIKELNKAVLSLAKKLGMKSYIILILVAVILLVFRKTLVSAVAISIMVLLAALVALHKRVTVVSTGVELSTFFAVVMTFAYGPLIASIGCIVMIGLGDFLSSREPVYTMAKMVIYPMLCVLTAVLSGIGASVLVAGMIIVVLMNIIFFFVWGFLSQFSFFWGPVTIVVNCIVNYFLLSHFGPALISMLTFF